MTYTYTLTFSSSLHNPNMIVKLFSELRFKIRESPKFRRFSLNYYILVNLGHRFFFEY